MPADSSARGVQLREQDLAGKCAVVTGASRGIGRAIAIELACRGCSILGTCSSTSSLHLVETISHTVSGLYKDGARAHAAPRIVGIAADILLPSTPSAVADAVGEHFNGHVDIFVNNAAITSAAHIGALGHEHIESQLMGNVQTPVNIMEQLVQRKQFGKNSRIVFISSLRARDAGASQLMYMATKSANESMCRAYADAFGGKNAEYEFMAGTTANSVMVGLTKTDALYNNPNVSKEMIKAFEDEFIPRQAIPRRGMPEDVAAVVGLLCREEARWITGSVVSADGGVVSIC